ncbi:MAG: hypothetical protein J5563_04770, partial [Clostridia bacterium]|nr:hypothetical protein [Clostridia bacterium]
MEEVSFEEQSEKHVPDAATERTRRRSAGAYAAECAFEYFTSLLVTDAFLTKVLKTIGTSDAACGIILSLASLAFVFQLCALLVISRIRNTKRFACTVHTVAQFLFSFLYLVPFLPFADGMRRSVFVVCMLLAYLGNHIVSSVIFKWGMSYVRNDRRARFTALKEAISLAAGIAVSLTVGIVTDSFDNSDNTAGFLIFTAVCMAIFALCDFICLMMIKAEQKKEKTAVIPLASALREVMSSRGFLRATVIQCLYYVALYSTIGFMGSYKQQELSYTLTQIQLINIAGIAARI